MCMNARTDTHALLLDVKMDARTDAHALLLEVKMDAPSDIPTVWHCP